MEFVSEYVLESYYCADTNFNLGVFDKWSMYLSLYIHELINLTYSLTCS